jgi:hypothetical protein
MNELLYKQKELTQEIKEVTVRIKNLMNHETIPEDNWDIISGFITKRMQLAKALYEVKDIIKRLK